MEQYLRLPLLLIISQLKYFRLVFLLFIVEFIICKNYARIKVLELWKENVLRQFTERIGRIICFLVWFCYFVCYGFMFVISISQKRLL